MEPAAATCLRLLDDAGKGVEDPQLQSAVAQLQSWAVAQPELGAAVSDGEWLQHVFQLVQQHQQQGGGGSGGAGGGGGGGGKAEKGAGGKRGASAARIRAVAASISPRDESGVTSRHPPRLCRRSGARPPSLQLRRHAPRHSNVRAHARPGEKHCYSLQRPGTRCR